MLSICSLAWEDLHNQNVKKILKNTLQFTLCKSSKQFKIGNSSIKHSWLHLKRSYFYHTILAITKSSQFPVSHFQSVSILPHLVPSSYHFDLLPLLRRFFKTVVHWYFGVPFNPKDISTLKKMITTAQFSLSLIKCIPNPISRAYNASAIRNTRSQFGLIIVMACILGMIQKIKAVIFIMQRFGVCSKSLTCSEHLQSSDSVPQWKFFITCWTAKTILLFKALLFQ